MAASIVKAKQTKARSCGCDSVEEEPPDENWELVEFDKCAGLSAIPAAAAGSNALLREHDANWNTLALLYEKPDLVSVPHKVLPPSPSAVARSYQTDFDVQAALASYVFVAVDRPSCPLLLHATPSMQHWLALSMRHERWWS